MPLFGLSLKDVEKMEAKRDVEGLIKALAYKKDEFLYSPSTGEASVGKYKDHALVRQAAAEALGRIGGEEAVDELVSALRDPDMKVRIGAAFALGDIGGEKAVDGLIAAFKDKDWSYRSKYVPDPGHPGHYAPRLVVVPGLREHYSSVRSSAAFALGKIGDARAVPALTASLQDPAVKVRESAAEALKEVEKKIRSGSYQPSSMVVGVQVNDLRSAEERTVASPAQLTLGVEDEEFAQKLAQLSKLSDIQYATDKAAYEKTAAEFRMIGEKLCANGGNERMTRIALRLQAFGGRSQDCEMYWAGICGWVT